MQFSSETSQPLLLEVFTDSTKFITFCRFYNIRYFRRFRKNCISCRGPLNPFFYRFSPTRLIFQIFADFTIFAILAVFAKIAVLVGALSAPSCTEFHRVDVFCNFLQILLYVQCSQCLQKSSFRRDPVIPFFYRFSLTQQSFQFFADITIFAILAVFALIAVLGRALETLLLQVFTDSTILPIFPRFKNILTFASFRKNCSSRRGPLNPNF